MHAVMFDPFSGRIAQVMTGSQETIASHGMPWIEVPSVYSDMEAGKMWDETHTVVDMQVVPK